MSARFVMMLATLLLLPCVTYAASPYAVVCPPTVTTTETSSEHLSKWQAWIAPISHTWQSVNFYDGHPKEMASLAPIKSTKQKATWQFASERDTYVSCGYYRSVVELIQILPKHIKQCVVTYDAMSYGEQGLIPKTIQCS